MPRTNQDPRKVTTMDEFHKFVNSFVLDANEVMASNIRIVAVQNELLRRCEPVLKHTRAENEIGVHHCPTCDLRQDLRKFLGMSSETEIPKEFQ